MISRGCWFLFRHWFSEFPTLNLFLGRFGPKNSKLFVLPESWHTWYLKDADSYSGISFLNFQPLIRFLGKFRLKKINLFLFPIKMETHGILEVLIPNPDLHFWMSDPKIHVWVKNTFPVYSHLKTYCCFWTYS